MPNGASYVGARTVENDPATHLPKEAGAINGGIVMRNEVVKTPTVTMNVVSIDETVKLIEAKGGKLLKDKMDTGGGLYAYASDSEGNVIGLWQNPEKAA